MRTGGDIAQLGPLLLPLSRQPPPGTPLRVPSHLRAHLAPTPLPGLGTPNAASFPPSGVAGSAVGVQWVLGVHGVNSGCNEPMGCSWGTTRAWGAVEVQWVLSGCSQFAVDTWGAVGVQRVPRVQLGCMGCSWGTTGAWGEVGVQWVLLKCSSRATGTWGAVEMQLRHNGCMGCSWGAAEVQRGAEGCRGTPIPLGRSPTSAQT